MVYGGRLPSALCHLHRTSLLTAEFRKCLKTAKLPKHFSPHCRRHTFASLLLQAGESPQYVKEQLGHASNHADGRYLRQVIRCQTDPRWRQYGWGSAW